MPLDITPTPMALPSDPGGGTASAAASGNALPGVAPTGIAALFSLLLAQTVSQAVPMTGSATHAVKTTASTKTSAANDVTAAFTADSTSADKTGDTKGSAPKNTQHTAGDGAAGQPAGNWAFLPTLPMTVVPTQTTAAKAAATATTTGTVMDTGSATTGESLPPSTSGQQAAPSGAAVDSGVTEIIVPTEPAAPDLSGNDETDAAGSPTPTPPAVTPPQVPALPLNASQAVMQPADSRSRSVPATQASVTPASAAPRTNGATAVTDRSAALTPSTGALPGSQTPGNAAGHPAADPSAAHDPPQGASATAQTVAGKEDAAKASTPAASQTSGTAGHSGVHPAASQSAAPDTPAALMVPAVTGGQQTQAPVTASPTGMPTADRQNMLTQVADQVKTLTVRADGSGPRQVTLQLHPQDWGQVRVSVTMTPTAQPDGTVATQVSAHVVAQVADVKTALETHQADLRQALKDAGLNLDRLTVTVQPSSGGAQAGLGGGHESRGSDWTGPDGLAGGGATAGGSQSQGGSSFSAFAQGGQGEAYPVPSAYATGLQAPAEASGTAAGTAITTTRVDTRA